MRQLQQRSCFNLALFTRDVGYNMQVMNINLLPSVVAKAALAAMHPTQLCNLSQLMHFVFHYVAAHIHRHQ